jgi:hypothetical protein
MKGPLAADGRLVDAHAIPVDNSSSMWRMRAQAGGTFTAYFTARHVRKRLNHPQTFYRFSSQISSFTF